MIRVFLWLSAALFIGCDRQNEIERSEWTAMGTIAAVQYCGCDSGLDVVKAAFTDIEELLNAHNENSELNQLASLTDAEILEKCNPKVRECYELAFKLCQQTGGRFNPRWRGKGTMDLGAIAKGYAVDVAAEELKRLGGEGRRLIDLGGNLKAVGGSWKVGVMGGGSFELGDGEACATSAAYYRGDHIRDGRNGATLTNDVHSVTIIHPTSATLADGLSTVMFILGREKGEKFLKDFYPEAKACWIFRE